MKYFPLGKKYVMLARHLTNSLLKISRKGTVLEIGRHHVEKISGKSIVLRSKGAMLDFARSLGCFHFSGKNFIEN